MIQLEFTNLATDTIQVGLFRSTDDQFSLAEDDLEAIKTFTITPFDQTPTHLEFQLDGSLILGTDRPFLLAVADPFDEVTEINKDNNVGVLGFQPDPSSPGRLLVVSQVTPATSRNFVVQTTTRSVNQIILHATAGTFLGTVQQFQNPSVAGSPSAHYIVAQDGKVTQVVRENDIANHAPDSNSNSIGIELVDNGGHRTNDNWAPTPLLAAAALLVRDIAQSNNIPLTHLTFSPTTAPFERTVALEPGTDPRQNGVGPNEPGIITHGQVLNRTIGDDGLAKDDPAIWDWHDFMLRVDAAFQATLDSPANLLITDPLGNRSGVDPVTGETLTEIAGTQFSGIGSHPQTLAFPFPVAGTYAIQVIGTDSGSFGLDVTTSDLGAGLASTGLTGETSLGQITTYVVH